MTASAELETAVPDVIGGRYRVVRVRGRGGMGIVYEAIDLEDQSRVAVKVLSAEMAGDEEVRRRLVREGRVLRSIRHPNIVAVRTVDVDGPVPFIVMDYLDGESLAERLKRGPIALGEVAAILVPVLEAVQAAHEAGIIHRDLKPDNIFLIGVGKSVKPYVLDFGIAKLTGLGDMGESQALTQSDAMIGTPRYMAPEQILNEGKIDGKVDVWAVGVIAYTALSGERPHDGDNLPQILKSVLTSQPKPLVEMVPDVPEGVARTIHACLSLGRESRPSIVEVADALRPHVARTISPPPLAALPPPSAPLLVAQAANDDETLERLNATGASIARRRRWLIGGAVAVSCGVAIGLVARLGGSDVAGRPAAATQAPRVDEPVSTLASPPAALATTTPTASVDAGLSASGEPSAAPSGSASSDARSSLERPPTREAKPTGARAPRPPPSAAESSKAAPAAPPPSGRGIWEKAPF